VVLHSYNNMHNMNQRYGLQYPINVSIKTAKLLIRCSFLITIDKKSQIFYPISYPCKHDSNFENYS